VFVGKHYASKEWCGLEWDIFLDLVKQNKTDPIMLIRVDDGEVPGLLSTAGYLDARRYSVEEIAEEIVRRVALIEAQAADSAMGEADDLAPAREKKVTSPGIFRYCLDRWFPRVHHFLTIETGRLSDPPERADLVAWLSQLSASIKNDFQEKTYLPLSGRTVPSHPLAGMTMKDPFVAPIHQIILHLAGRIRGGDSASAQIAAMNRRSRVVRNLLRAIESARDPLILLGEPGSGKTMTLQAATKARADREKPPNISTSRALRPFGGVSC